MKRPTVLHELVIATAIVAIIGIETGLVFVSGIGLCSTTIVFMPLIFLVLYLPTVIELE